MKNPLNKRYLRQLRSEAGKYLVIFILLVATIGFVSGFLVADGSMIKAYNESFEKYRVEDGHFETRKALNKAQKKAVEALGVTLYDLPYAELPMTSRDARLRLYANRTSVDLACIMAGRLPEQAGEVAIDRMFADNNELKVGDEISCTEGEFKIVGLVALGDYSTMFSDNNDTMFDAMKFGVGVVSKDQFESLKGALKTSNYAWVYNDPPADDTQASAMSEDFMKALVKEVKVETYVPRFANQAIIFTGEDMGSDRGMMIVLLYIIIVILAFVFAVTTSDTIAREASVIGTLRASGYTKKELIRHYMILSILISLIGAFAGNILGYSVLKDVCVMMYYNSYSLPAYQTVWNGEAFVLTTIIPILMMIVINRIILGMKLQLPPLKFLRHDLKRRRQRRAIRLSPHIPFLSRFRIRIFIQNLGSYLVLFFGIAFANLLLMFGLGLPEVLDNFKENAEQTLIANYQYMLQVPVSMTDDSRKLESFMNGAMFARAVETENEDAEKFSAYALKTTWPQYREQEVAIYGIEPDSTYVPLSLKDGEVYMTSGLAHKYDLKTGDSLTLKEPYEDTAYTFTLRGIYDYETSIGLFMNRRTLNEIFDYDKDFFCGYFSASPLTDIDEAYVGSVITLDDLLKVSRQLDISMGSMMYLVDGFAILMFLVLMYLLTKIIIEKNSNAIALTKILGYSGGEIARLYLVATSIVVIISTCLSLPFIYRFLVWVFKMMVRIEMTGWFPLEVSTSVFVKIIIMGIVSYAVVALIEYHKIRRMPMDSVLKNVE